MDRSVLARKPMTELKDIASHLNMRGYQKLRKAELIDAIISSGSDAQQSLDTGSPEAGSPEAGSPEAEAPATDQPSEGTAAPADASQAAEGGASDDDGDGDGGSRRRSRRDRRKRTRDRDDAQSGDADDDARDQQGRSEQGRSEQGRSEQGRSEQGRSEQGRSDQGRSDQGRSPQGKGGGQEPGEVRAGVLDILPEGYGFLRTTGYLPGERDVYVSQGQIRKHGLRRGDVVQGPIRQQRSNEKVPALHHVQKVNGEGLEDGQVPSRPSFDDLAVDATPSRLPLAAADAPGDLARLIDLVAPIGLGHRILLLTPPRAPKDQLVRELAEAVTAAAPDVHTMALLLDERPEVVAVARDAIDGEVIASTFDQPAEDHAQIADLAVERARRMVELGHDVVVIVDSLTRLARAHGVITPGSGRPIAPGVEAASLYPVKRLLSAARRVQGGGSLTVLAVTLVGTGSPLDEVILQEVRRTATTEIVLDEVLTSRRVWPSVSVLASDTLEEAGLQSDGERAAVTRVRRALEGLSAADATALVLDRVAQTSTNDDLVASLVTGSLTAAPAGEGA